MSEIEKYSRYAVSEFSNIAFLMGDNNKKVKPTDLIKSSGLLDK